MLLIGELCKKAPISKFKIQVHKLLFNPILKSTTNMISKLAAIKLQSSRVMHLIGELCKKAPISKKREKTNVLQCPISKQCQNSPR